MTQRGDIRVAPRQNPPADLPEHVLGAWQTNPLPAGYHDRITNRIKRTVGLTEPGLKIVRLRLLSDPGLPLWYISYCHGMVGDEPVRVDLGIDQIPKRVVCKTLVALAKMKGVYGKGMGLLDNISCMQ